MNFGEQIKDIRKQHNMTQEEFSQKLNVSRQAISNWENNRNLPDIEMLILVAEVFNVSLDQLILGGKNNMNNMTEKLIKDGSETRRAKFNMISICVGFALLLLGVACLAIKASSVEYIDASGMLHENFFLLPISFMFFLGGFVTFFVIGIRNTVILLHNKTVEEKKVCVISLCISMVVTALCIFAVLLVHMGVR